MIIINSDDFGISPEINEATHRAFAEGLISSTTTLVNFEEGLKDAMSYLKTGKIDENAVGIHLNLTEGTPLTEKMRSNVRFCENGNFKNIRIAGNVFKLDEHSKNCVLEELDAQIAHFIKSFGFKPSHIDSHHHIHTEWAVLQRVLKLAKKYKIRYVRLARNTGESQDFKKSFYRVLINGYIKFKGVKSTDKFGGIDDLYFAGVDPNKSYEIMVHAITDKKNNQLVDLDHVNLSEKLDKLLGSKPWNIMNYSDLAKIRE